MPAGRSAILLALLAIALPAVALLVSLPSKPVIYGVLNNAAHAPVFGLLSVVLLLLMRRFAPWPDWARFGSAFALAVAAGGAVELIQPMLGRGAEWRDLWTDTLGVSAGLAAAAFVSLPRRWLSALVFSIAAGVAFWPVADASLAYWQRMRQFPTVLDFSSPSDWYFVRIRGADFETGLLPERWQLAQDPPSLRLRMTGGRWPGITHVEPQPDWRAHARLLLDLTNPADDPLTLTLRVHDRTHGNRANDRFNRTFTLPPATRTVLVVPLREIAAAPDRRELDLAEIAGLILFGGSGIGNAGREYYLTRIWLE